MVARNKSINLLHLEFSNTTLDSLCQSFIIFASTFWSLSFRIASSSIICFPFVYPSAHSARQTKALDGKVTAGVRGHRSRTNTLLIGIQIQSAS